MKSISIQQYKDTIDNYQLSINNKVTTLKGVKNIFFTSACNYSRVKFRELTKNKYTIVRKLELADVVVINEKFTSLPYTIYYNSAGNIRSSWHPSHNIEGYASNNMKHLKDFTKFIVSKPTILYTDLHIEITNGAKIIDHTNYQYIRDCLKSKDNSIRIMALNILNYCDFNNSIRYLRLLKDVIDNSYGSNINRAFALLINNMSPIRAYLYNTCHTLFVTTEKYYSDSSTREYKDIFYKKYISYYS